MRICGAAAADAISGQARQPKPKGGRRQKLHVPRPERGELQESAGERARFERRLLQQKLKQIQIARAQ